MDKSRIYLCRTEDRPAFVRKVFEVFEDEIRGRKILLKPNIVSHEPYPTTTHPEVLGTLLDLLQGEDVTCGDASAAELFRPGQVLKNHELSALCRTRGYRMLNLYDHPMAKQESPRGFTIKFSTVPRDYDYVISLPVLKSHINVRMTGALKNHFGYLARSERTRLHMRRGETLEQAIAELHVMCPAHLFIVDAVTTLTRANEMRHGGKPVPLGYMLAGKDPVALDAFGLTLLYKTDPRLKGLAPPDIPHLRLAQEFGVGRFEYEIEEI
jgi:uncharacterized protein (DUF362 family)